MAARDIIGWPNVETQGVGVWIDERLKFNAFPEVTVRDRKLIYPIPIKPKDWRKTRLVIVSRVHEVIPAAALKRYHGGVADFDTPTSTVRAFVNGYDASWRRMQDAAATREP